VFTGGYKQSNSSRLIGPKTVDLKIAFRFTVFGLAQADYVMAIIINRQVREEKLLAGNTVNFR